MDRVLRLMFALLLLSVASLGFAATPGDDQVTIYKGPGTWTVSCGAAYGGDKTAGSGEAAIDACISAMNSVSTSYLYSKVATPYSETGPSGSPPSYTGGKTTIITGKDLTGNYGSKNYSAYAPYQESCPNFATANADSMGCTCQAGYQASGDLQSCVPRVEDDVCADTAGAPYYFASLELAGKDSMGQVVDVCSPNGCGYTGTVGFAYQDLDGNWISRVEGERGTGHSCTPGDGETDGTATDTDNKLGKCSGTINETVVTYDCVTTTDDHGTKSSTTTNADGSTVQTEVNRRTECDAGTCTTTTTTTTTMTTAGGAVSTAVEGETVTQTKDQYCEQNPGSGSCGGSQGGSGSGSGDCTGPDCGDGEDSAFGGSCMAGFSCEGDAVQCAMAREQHERNCQLFEGDETLRDAVKDIDGTPITEGSILSQLPSTGVDVSSALAVDTSDLGCPIDLSLTVSGHTLTVPFSEMCDGLRFMGQIAYAMSLAFCVFFLIRSVGN